MEFIRSVFKMQRTNMTFFYTNDIHVMIDVLIRLINDGGFTNMVFLIYFTLFYFYFIFLYLFYIKNQIIYFLFFFQNTKNMNY